MAEGSNFQPADPGNRGGRPGPRAALPDGVVTPEDADRKRKAGPRAQIPDQYRDPLRPDSQIGMVAVSMVVLGLYELAGTPQKTGHLVFSVLFTLFGTLGCVAWVQAWWWWRRAWRFEWRFWTSPKGRWWR